MKIYTFAISGNVRVKAKSEEDAYKIANDIIAPTSYAHENCVGITVDDIELIAEHEDIDALKSQVSFYKELVETLKDFEENYPHKAKSEVTMDADSD